MPLRGYVELWDVASADINVAESLDSGRGGEGGMLFRVRPPVWLRLSYGIEHLRLGSGARLETVDRLEALLPPLWRSTARWSCALFIEERPGMFSFLASL